MTSKKESTGKKYQGSRKKLEINDVTRREKDLTDEQATTVKVWRT